MKSGREFGSVWVRFSQRSAIRAAGSSSRVLGLCCQPTPTGEQSEFASVSFLPVFNVELRAQSIESRAQSPEFKSRSSLEASWNTRLNHANKASAQESKNMRKTHHEAWPFCPRANELY